MANRLVLAAVIIAVTCGIGVAISRGSTGASQPAVTNAAAAKNGCIPAKLETVLEILPTFLAIQRVQTLNLVNGLFLSDEQLDLVISQLQELQRLEERQAALRPRLVSHRQELESVRGLLQEVETFLVRGEQPPDEVSRDVYRMEQELMELFVDFGRLDEQINGFSELANISIYEALTDNQRVLTQEYVECLIPPAGDPSNPERIGQATGEVYEQLKAIRELDEQQYKLARANLIEEYYSFIVKHYVDVQQGAAVERQRLGLALDEIRSMNAGDFALNQKQVEKLLIPHATHARQQIRHHDPEIVKERIFKFFVENNALDLLVSYRQQR